MNRSNEINRTPNGLMFFCNSCSLIHIEFKNMNFNFTYNQLQTFVEYISEQDAEDWELKNKHSPFSRKIVLAMDHQSFNFLLNPEELAELKLLLLSYGNQLLKHKLLRNVDADFRSN